MSTYKIQLRGDISSNWTSVNPILDERELVIETDTLAFKIGNGVLNWNSLPYANVSTAGANMTFSAGTIALQNSITLGSVYATTVSATTYQGVPYDTSFAISDETTQITTGTSKITFYVPRNFTLQKVKVSLSTSGSTTTKIDVNYNGTSLLSSPPISLTSGVFVNSTTSLATTTLVEDGKITVDIDEAGTGAIGAKVYLIGKNT